MTIHFIWGNDSGGIDHRIENLIKDIVDPTWSSLNLSRIDGSDPNQLNRALEEVRTPPFGAGGRIVLVKKSPFCNSCPNDLAIRFEETVELIPIDTHLILQNESKPDKRLKSTKMLFDLIKKQKAIESSFVLPAIWDGAGQRKFIEKTAFNLNIAIENDAVLALIESIGVESSRLFSELKKLSLLAEARNTTKETSDKKVIITLEIVNSLIEGITTNSLEVGDCLLGGKTSEAILKIDVLLNSGEPPLRVLATLSGQVRGLLWVKLLEEQGEKDVGVIAKAAGISNPKRIYIMRKQMHGKSTKMLLNLLSNLLSIEVSLKKGVTPGDAFRDNLITLF